MKRKIVSHKFTPINQIVKLESCNDKLGNIYHRVTCSNGELENEYYLFSKLSSALDFINSNFE